MAYFHDYSFEDRNVTFRNQDVLASGNFCVAYTIEDAQDDCGYPGGIEFQNFDTLSVVVTFENDDMVKVTDEAELADLLAQLLAQIDLGYISDEIEESL